LGPSLVLVVRFYDPANRSPVGAPRAKTARQIVMKLRHAVAPALVGWYLMFPLPGHEAAPIAYWENFASYDSKP
jgi:hypothetical protein